MKMKTLRAPIINAVRNITCGDIFHNAPPNSGAGSGYYSDQFMNTNSASGSMNFLMSPCRRRSINVGKSTCSLSYMLSLRNILHVNPSKMIIMLSLMYAVVIISSYSLI